MKEHIKPDTDDKIFFVVPLFSKKMFGHFVNEMENEKICLVSWEFSLNWQDELKGVIKHQIKTKINFSEDTFFCGIELG